MSAPDELPISVAEFGMLFQRFMEATVEAVPLTESPLGERLRQHLGAGDSDLPVIAEDFEPFDHPNLQVALDFILSSPDYRVEIVGLNAQMRFFPGFSLATILARRKVGAPGPPMVSEGSVEYVNVRLDGRVLRCLQLAVLLISRGEERLAALVMGPNQQMGPQGLKVRLQLMSATSNAIEDFLNRIRAEMDRLNVYRSRVFSLSATQFGSLQANFQELPRIRREQVILPAGTLNRIERQTVVFAGHAERLRVQQRHIKRGILLYGPPGTGKTLTIMYLAAQMPERTTILLTGGAMGLIPSSCHLARTLQPAMLVIEDVDLIAEDRSRAPMGAGPLLFELLNQMDGLAEDADVIFLLTSNRPEILEPALAARPGRVDEAVELPLPDAECRRRLFELYGQGLDLDVQDFTPFVERTQGVAAAFIKEVMRRAALRAAEASIEKIGHTELDSAVDDLLAGGRLAQRLLGMLPDG